MNEIKKLYEIINNSSNIVFFGGAGVSTGSGLKDFRSKDGIYNIKSKYSPEVCLSSSMFYHNPKEFYTFYRKNMNSLNAKPNNVHNYLKKLEERKKLKAIITQNIDGLHTKAGSNNVLEIHGSIYRNYCISCHSFYDAKYIFNSNALPICEKCGNLIKPDVVLYGEMLPECFITATLYIKNAETLIVAGTSLTVEPASSLINLFQGKNLIILNNEETKYDKVASLVIHDNLNKIFSDLINLEKEELKK